MAEKSETKSKGIIFGAEMVKAILAERKTQTRRIVKARQDTIVDLVSDEYLKDKGFAKFDTKKVHSKWIDCPYGKVGDELYVKENWLTGMGDMHYRADGEVDSEFLEMVGGWKSCRFMPRWASRITLRITNIRVEKVCDISHKDALAEGVEYDVSKEDGSPLARFQKLWSKINGAETWNNWVWAISFEVIKK